MIKTATGTMDLKELELILQEKLDSEPFPIVSAKISCLLREQNLLIMVQYPEPVMPYPKKIFRLLRETLASVAISQQYQVLIYLVVVGQNQSQIAPFNFESLESSKSEALVSTSEENSLIEENLLPNQVISREKLKKIPLSLLKFFGIGLGLAAFLGLIYGFTRPCVLGTCELIPQAEKIANEALADLKTNPNLAQISETQQHLLKSIQILESIPSWSFSYSEVTKLKGGYQKTRNQLNQLQSAIESATQAITQQKTTNLSLQAWQKIATLWQEAITNLQKIPNDSQFFGFAQSKLKEYEKNSQIVAQRVKLEEEAKKMLDSAQEAAKLGELRSSVATSVSNWQQVEATWKTAIKRLKNIPQQTSVYPQGQELLKQYNYHLSQAIKEKQQEQVAVNSYNIALNQAEIAKNFEDNNQWSEAVVEWEQAVNVLKNISKNSFKYSRAKPLIDSFKENLLGAEKKQQASVDIQKICFSQIVICNYSIKDQGIQIYLTPDYVKEVAQIASDAQNKKDNNTKTDLRVHLSSLDQSFQIISNNAQIPVEVYNSSNVLMVKYMPR